MTSQIRRWTPSHRYLRSKPRVASSFTTSTTSCCFQLSNVDVDGEVLVSLLSAKSIVDGIPLAELKIPHTSGDADVHCFNLSLPSNTNDSFAVMRIKVLLLPLRGNFVRRNGLKKNVILIIFSINSLKKGLWRCEKCKIGGKHRPKQVQIVIWTVSPFEVFKT